MSASKFTRNQMIIGGVVVAVAIGTTIYFIARDNSGPVVDKGADVTNANTNNNNNVVNNDDTSLEDTGDVAALDADSAAAAAATAATAAANAAAANSAATAAADTAATTKANAAAAAAAVTPVVSTSPSALVERFKDKKVILTNYHKSNLQLNDSKMLGTSPNTGDWEQWALEPITGRPGSFWILNPKFNVRLRASDDAATVGTTDNKGAWEVWTLVPVAGASTDLFYVVSAFGRQLGQGPEGNVYQSENKGDWEKWTIVPLAGSIISRAIDYAKVFAGRARSSGGPEGRAIDYAKVFSGRVH